MPITTVDATPETLNFCGLKEDVLRILSGEKIHVNVGTFQNDLVQIGSRDEALTALIHLGYLAYDRESQTACLPNYEVGKAFQDALEKGVWADVAQTISKCDELLETTIRRDEKKVAELVVWPTRRAVPF